MGEWKTTELSPNLCTIIAGSTPATVDARYWEGENVWITPNDLSRFDGHIIRDSNRKLTDLGVKRATGKLLPAHSVVISCRAPVGYCAIVSVPFSTNQGCKTLICHGINETYLYYVLTQSTAALERVSSGTTFLELPKKELAQFKMSFPVSSAEQSKIAEILLTMDEAIDKTRALIEKYKNIKVGMMHDLLTNGIDEYGNIRSTETHEYNDSLVGKIPAEWDVQPLSNLTEKIADRDHTTPNYVMHGVYIVSPKDFDEYDRINFSKCARISHKDHMINRKKTDIRRGDLIFTRIGAGLGKVCCVTEDMPEFSILHSAAMVRVNRNITALLLMYIIKSFYFQKQISDGIQSIGVPDLGLDKINSLLVSYPTNGQEQERITEILVAADERIQTERDYLAKLQDIKQGLMQDLLTNTVSVDALL